MTLIQFIHLDDQSEKVTWIPRQMISWLWQQYRTKLATYPSIDESEDEMSFVIKAEMSGHPLEVRYDIVESTEAFWDKLEDAPHLKGVILDQWVGEDQHAGSQTFRRLEKEKPDLAPRTLLLTAYPNETCGQLGWKAPHEQLQTKPPVQEAVLNWLVRQGFEDLLAA